MFKFSFLTTVALATALSWIALAGPASAQSSRWSYQGGETIRQKEKFVFVNAEGKVIGKSEYVTAIPGGHKVKWAGTSLCGIYYANGTQRMCGIGD